MHAQPWLPLECHTSVDGYAWLRNRSQHFSWQPKGKPKNMKPAKRLMSQFLLQIVGQAVEGAGLQEIFAQVTSSFCHVLQAKESEAKDISGRLTAAQEELASMRLKEKDLKV